MIPLQISKAGIISDFSGIPSKIKIASSEEERKTASNVPGEIREDVKRFAPSTGIPHSGMQPSNPPRSGPAFRKRISIVLFKRPEYFPNSSNIRNARKRKGKSRRLSIAASVIKSIIISDHLIHVLLYSITKSIQRKDGVADWQQNPALLLRRGQDGE